MTDYMVLRQIDKTDRPGAPEWMEFLIVGGRTPAHAIQSAIEMAKGTGDQNGVYIAVPDSSWNPLTVEIQQVTRIKVGAATETKP